MRNAFIVRRFLSLTLCATLGVACGDGSTPPDNTGTSGTTTSTSSTSSAPSSSTTSNTTTSNTTTSNTTTSNTTTSPTSSNTTTTSPPTTTTTTAAPTSSSEPDPTSSADDASSTTGEDSSAAPLTPFTFEEVKAFIAADVGSTLPNCYECHDRMGGDKPYVFAENDMIYQQLIDTVITRCENRKLVEPGDADNSALYLVLNGTCGTVTKMPYGCYESADGLYNDCTKHEDRERLRLWIEAGAPRE